MKDPPSRERVSAAIAMVRARQAATTGIQEEEETDSTQLHSPSKRSSLVSPPSPEILRNTLVKGGTGTTRAPLTPKEASTYQQSPTATAHQTKSQMLSPSSASTQAPKDAAAKEKSPPMSFFFNVFGRRTNDSKTQATDQENAPEMKPTLPPPPPPPPPLVIPPPPPPPLASTAVAEIKRVPPPNVTTTTTSTIPSDQPSPDASARARRLANIRARVLARREERTANSSTTSSNAPPDSATLAALISPKAGEGMKKYMEHWEQQHDPKDMSPTQYPVLLDSEISKDEAEDHEKQLSEVSSGADDSSDEEEDIPNVDPDTLANVTRFIDALHQHQAPPQQRNEEHDPAFAVAILETMSSGSETSLPDTAVFDPDVLQGLGNLIDKLQEKKTRQLELEMTTQPPAGQGVVLAQSDDDDEPELTDLPTYQHVSTDYSATFTDSTLGEVQPETLAHIVAYIDSLSNVPKPLATPANGNQEIVDMEEDNVDPPNAHQLDSDIAPDLSASAPKMSDSLHNSSGRLYPGEENEENEQRGNFDLRIVSTESKTTTSILETRMEEYMLHEPSTSSSDDTPQQTMMEVVDVSVTLGATQMTLDRVASKQVDSKHADRFNPSVQIDDTLGGNPLISTTAVHLESVATLNPNASITQAGAVTANPGSINHSVDDVERSTTGAGTSYPLTPKSEPGLMLESFSEVSTTPSGEENQKAVLVSVADRQEEVIGNFIDSLNLSGPEPSEAQEASAANISFLENDVNGKLAAVHSSSSQMSLPSLKNDTMDKLASSVSSCSLHLFEQDVKDKLAAMVSVTETPAAPLESNFTSATGLPDSNQPVLLSQSLITISALAANSGNQEHIIGAFIDSLTTGGSNNALAVHHTLESLKKPPTASDSDSPPVAGEGTTFNDHELIGYASEGGENLRHLDSTGSIDFDPIALARSESNRLGESFAQPETYDASTLATRDQTSKDPADLSGIAQVRSFLLAVGSNDSNDISVTLDLDDENEQAIVEQSPGIRLDDQICDDSDGEAATASNERPPPSEPVAQETDHDPVTATFVTTSMEEGPSYVLNSANASSELVDDIPSASLEENSTEEANEKTHVDLVMEDDGDVPAQVVPYVKMKSEDTNELPATDGIFRAPPLTLIEDEKKDDSSRDDDDGGDGEEDSIESIKYVQVESFDSTKVLPVPSDQKIGAIDPTLITLFDEVVGSGMDQKTGNYDHMRENRLFIESSSDRDHIKIPNTQQGEKLYPSNHQDVLVGPSSQTELADLSMKPTNNGDDLETPCAASSNERELELDGRNEVKQNHDLSTKHAQAIQQGLDQGSVSEPEDGNYESSSIERRVSCSSSQSRNHLIGEDIFKTSTTVSLDHQQENLYTESAEQADFHGYSLPLPGTGDKVACNSNQSSREASRASRSPSTDEEFSLGVTTDSSRELSEAVHQSACSRHDSFIIQATQHVSPPLKRKSKDDTESFDSSRASSGKQRSSVAEYTQNLRLVGTFAINPQSREVNDHEANDLFNIARESERLDLLVHSLLQVSGSDESSNIFPDSTSKCTSDDAIEHLQLSSCSSHGIEQGYEVNNNLATIASRSIEPIDVGAKESAPVEASLSSPVTADLPETSSMPISDTEIGLHSEVFQAANVVVESMKLADQLLHNDGEAKLEMDRHGRSLDFDYQPSDELSEIDEDVVSVHRSYMRKDLTIETKSFREDDEKLKDKEDVTISALLDRLSSPQGASEEEIALLNNFTKVAAPILQGLQPSAVEEARIRQASQRAGLPIHFVDHVLDLASVTNLELAQSSSTSTVGGGTPKHMKKTFDEISEIDENENILAFFRRFAALKEGGHFPGANIEALGSFGRVSKDGEEVEVDATRGFVRKEFERTDSSQADADAPKCDQIVESTKSDAFVDTRSLHDSCGGPKVLTTTLHQAPGHSLKGDNQAPESEAVSSPSIQDSNTFKENDPDDFTDFDENENIVAFFRRFSALNAGGHFPDANLEAMGSFGRTSNDEDEVEVDVTRGFVRKELDQSHLYSENNKVAVEPRRQLTPLDVENQVSSDASEPLETLDGANCQLMEPELAISALLDRLTSPEGASDDEIEHLNEFVKVASPILKGLQPSAIEEALIRQASRRAGLPIHFVDQVLDLVSQRNLDIRASASSSTVGVSTPKHLKKVFEEMTDVDENENISAFLRRFASLEAGGHFPHANIEALGPFAKLSRDGDEVEVDLDRGFVRKEYEQGQDGREEVTKLPATVVEALDPTVVEKTRTQQISQRVGLPLQVVEKLIDRALERSSVASTSRSAEGSTPKHQKKVFDDISDVDESENISAFLNRLSALKAGGHFPDLNLDNLGSLLTKSSDGDAVEIDLKCGFVKKQLADADPYTSTRLDTLSPLSNEMSVTSDDGIQQLNKFIEAVAPLLKESQPSAVEEAQIRQAAQKAGVPLELVDKLVGNSVQTATDDEDNFNNVCNEYDEIEDVDENEAIDAFLHRFTALKQGGHFPDGSLEALGPLGQLSPENDEAVEIDVAHGFVRKDLAPCLSDDKPWWQNGDATRDAEEKDSNASARYESLATVVSRQIRESEFKLADTPKELLHLSRGGRYDSAEDWDLAFGANRERVSKSSSQPKDSLLGNEATTDAFTFYQELESRFSNNDEWIMKLSMANWGNPFKKNWLTRSVRIGRPKPINGVAAAGALTRRSLGTSRRRNCGGPRHWKRSYKQRTRNHPGYFNVDVYSLYETSLVARPPHPLDYIPWENRDVRQRFLHEQSITFCRNWFGKHLLARQ